jgi:hypothetical protein
MIANNGKRRMQNVLISAAHTGGPGRRALARPVDAERLSIFSRYVSAAFAPAATTGVFYGSS